MRKTVGALVLSLVLLLPAQIVLAASNEEKILMRLDRLEKQIQVIKAGIHVRMAEGKKMSSATMEKAMKMLEKIEQELEDLDELKE